MHESIERDTPEVEGVRVGETRKSFLKQAGVGGAVVLGGGALLGAVAGPARAGHEDSVPDVDILNFALTLEYLEASFYTEGLGARGRPVSRRAPPSSAGEPSQARMCSTASEAGFGAMRTAT